MTTAKHILSGQKSIEILPDHRVILADGDHFINWSMEEALEALMFALQPENRQHPIPAPPWRDKPIPAK